MEPTSVIIQSIIRNDLLHVPHKSKCEWTWKPIACDSLWENIRPMIRRTSAPAASKSCHDSWHGAFGGMVYTCNEA